MKRSEAARYARWSALAALSLAAITGGIYLRRQWIAHVERTKAPPSLTEDKERQSIGLTLSKDEGDRTIFTVQASKSTDFKGQERVLCFNASDGKPLWEHKYDCNYTVSYPSGPRAAPTATA